MGRIGAVDWGESILVDHYVRGEDLVARYGRSGDPSLTYEVYWRCQTAQVQSAGIDVIVSAQTDALEADPTLTIASELSAEQLLVPNDDRANDFHAMSLEDIPRNCDIPQPLLFRLSDAPVSYVEMIQPGDCVETRLTAGTQNLRVTRELFTDHLEKGVIRRARARYLLLPRDNDVKLAGQLYRELLEQAPPLTT